MPEFSLERILNGLFLLPPSIPLPGVCKISPTPIVVVTLSHQAIALTPRCGTFKTTEFYSQDMTAERFIQMLLQSGCFRATLHVSLFLISLHHYFTDKGVASDELPCPLFEKNLSQPPQRFLSQSSFQQYPRTIASSLFQLSPVTYHIPHAAYQIVPSFP
jgi:hypothetical protein